MSQKLTLSIDKNIIESAKIYARLKETSVSELVEQYLATLTNDEKTSSELHGQITNSLRGSMKYTGSSDYKEELTRSLVEKYIKND